MERTTRRREVEATILQSLAAHTAAAKRGIAAEKQLVALRGERQCFPRLVGELEARMIAGARSKRSLAALISLAKKLSGPASGPETTKTE